MASPPSLADDRPLPLLCAAHAECGEWSVPFSGPLLVRVCLAHGSKAPRNVSKQSFTAPSLPVSTLLACGSHSHQAEKHVKRR